MKRVLFSVSRLEKEDVELSGVLPGAEFLDLAEDDGFAAAGDCAYELCGHYVDGGVLVQGRAECTVSGCCGRCLKPVVVKLEKPDIKLYFENVQEEELDVTGDLREELLTELPANLLCSPECRGLCPHCGADRNATDCSCSGGEPETPGDPAWGELDKLDFSSETK